MLPGLFTTKYSGVLVIISMGDEVTGGSCRWTMFLMNPLDCISSQSRYGLHVLNTVPILDYGIGGGNLPIDRSYTSFQSKTLDDNHMTELTFKKPEPRT